MPSAAKHLYRCNISSVWAYYSGKDASTALSMTFFFFGYSSLPYSYRSPGIFAPRSRATSWASS